jgi:hypothetical protein
MPDGNDSGELEDVVRPSTLLILCIPLQNLAGSSPPPAALLPPSPPEPRCSRAHAVRSD